MPITTTGLIQFVLANASPRVRIQSSFQLCSSVSCLLYNLHYYSSQSSRALRILSHLRRTLYELNRDIVWKRTYRHEKHEREVNSFVDHLRSDYRRARRRARRLCGLLHLLKSRVIRFMTGLQSEVTQDFVEDMMTLIQEKRALPFSKSSVKKTKKKKSKKKAREEGRDEL